MKRLALVALLSACSSDPSIDGTWALTLNDACGMGITFDSKAGSYATSVLCTLQTGAGADVEYGDATFADGNVTMIPRRASCPSAMHSSDTSAYSFKGGKLVLASTTGPVGVFERPPEGPPPSTIVQTGCWDMGVFTPHAVEPL
jgi:hypothetical protein